MKHTQYLILKFCWWFSTPFLIVLRLRRWTSHRFVVLCLMFAKMTRYTDLCVRYPVTNWTWWPLRYRDVFCSGLTLLRGSQTSKTFCQVLPISGSISKSFTVLSESLEHFYCPPTDLSHITAVSKYKTWCLVYECDRLE